MENEVESTRSEQQEDELQNENTKNEETEDSTSKEEEITDNAQASSIHDAGKHFVEDGCTFQPVIYSFEVQPGLKPVSVMNATEPPFPIYLDHAIGVIWVLFRKQGKRLGTDELLWCLRFLQKLVTCDGQYTEHVNICMKTIQDHVIDQYIRMGSGREEDTTTSKSATITDDLLEQQIDTTDAVNQRMSASESDTPGYGFSSPDVYSYMDIKSSTPNRRQSTDEKGFITLMSLTYNEMVSRESNGFIGETPNIERPLDISGTSTEYMEMASRKSSDLLDISPKLMDFLLSTRKLLIDRIKEELIELYNLEKFMGTIDRKSFTAYITEDLAKRLERLDTDDVARADVTYMHHIVTKLINSIP